MMKKVQFRVWDTIIRKMVSWDECRDTGLLDEAFDGHNAIAMMCVWIKDCRGNLVYEGDIINHGSYKTLGVIEFDCGAFAMLFKTKHYTDREDFIDLSNKFEVVGNIFEHPHLLKNE